MLAFMLDPKCKSMRLVITYLGCEAATTLVADYDEHLLLFLLLEAYKGLLPNRRVYLDEFASLVDSQDLILETNRTIDTYKDIICYELNSFHYYLIDAKKNSCALTWWRIEKQKFPIVVVVARQILESQLVRLKLKKLFPFLESSQHSGDVDFKSTIWTS